MGNVRDVVIAGFENEHGRTSALQRRSKPAVRERETVAKGGAPRRELGAVDKISSKSEGALRHLFESDEAHQKTRSEVSFRINAFCKEHPVEAFNIATDILTQVADRTSDMVAESGQALALMEARRERIDRLQAENRRMLDTLVAGDCL